MHQATRIALTTALLAVAGAGAAFAISPNILISEFRTRGTGGASDEFVEIWNNSSSTVNISGWKLNYSSSGGVVATRVTVPASTTLGPGCYYLFTNSGGTYSGGVAGDATYLTGLADDGGIAILDAASAILDQAGMSAGSVYKEGTVLAPLTTNVNQGYERKPGGGSGNSIDSDNNATDFRVLAPSNPQNRASLCLSATPADRGTWGQIKILYR
jgi:hypothetical protein